ncbi:hypothetical protein D3C77_572200 [compost metagenome]
MAWEVPSTMASTLAPCTDARLLKPMAWRSALTSSANCSPDSKRLAWLASEYCWASSTRALKVSKVPERSSRA